jgi:hypothetical protein
LIPWGREEIPWERTAGLLTVARFCAQPSELGIAERTNCTETDSAKVWEWYLQLQQSEAAFRHAKGDLSLRPIFHHKNGRVEAHILVCFLSLALWRTLERWMRGKGLGTCARQLVSMTG